jgi:vacuolar-type H+-ATPase subunit E/Vma4
MGIEALRAAVEREARAQIAELLDGANAQADALRAEAQEATAARRREMLGDEESRLRRDAAARIAATRSAKQKRVLEARDAMLDRVFALTGEQLSTALKGELAREWLVGIASQSLRYLPEGRVVFECSEDVVALLAQAFAGRDRIEVRCDPDLPCGFRACSQDGSIIVDATLSKLLEMQRPRLAIEVLQRLERGAEG